MKTIMKLTERITASNIIIVSPIQPIHNVFFPPKIKHLAVSQKKNFDALIFDRNHTPALKKRVYVHES